MNRLRRRDELLYVSFVEQFVDDIRVFTQSLILGNSVSRKDKTIFGKEFQRLRQIPFDK